MQKKEGIAILLFVLLTTSITLSLYSGYQLFIENNFIPHSLLFGGSIFGTIGFSAVLFSGLKGVRGATLTLFTLANSLLFSAYYFYPYLLKEFYSFSLWSLILIVLYSLQQVIERHKKNYASIARILNYGLIFALLPFMFFKSDNAVLWFVIGTFTGLILLLDLIIFLLPAKKFP
jgi:hypothetical protein